MLRAHNLQKLYPCLLYLLTPVNWGLGHGRAMKFAAHAHTHTHTRIGYVYLHFSFKKHLYKCMYTT